MFKKGIALAVSFLMVFSLALGVSLTDVKVSAGTVFDENNIVLRFPALSDIHCTTATSVQATKFKNALTQLKAKGDLDAILIGGDFTDYGQKSQTKVFADILRSELDLDDTRLVLAMGNHELFDHELNGVDFAVNDYLKEFLGDQYENGASADDVEACRYHTTVNGIHLLAISCFEYNGGVQFRQEDLDWLDKELAKTSKTAPVFVTMHPMMHGMQWGSDCGAYWATQDDAMIDIFKKYPQCVVFSGHMHFPLNDERSIHQDGFTTVGTGSVYYASMDDKDADGTTYTNMGGYEFSASDNFSQGLLVEVDGNGATRLTRMDFFNNTTIKTPWIIPAPDITGAQNSVYTTAAQKEGNQAPAFPSSVTMTAAKAAGNVKALDFTFTRATDNDMVLDYTVTFYNKETNQPVRSVVLYNDFIRKASETEATISYRVAERSLYPFSCEYADDYYYTVVARDSFGLISAPITSDPIEGTGVQKVPVVIDETPEKDWQYKLYCNFNKFTEGYVMGGNDYNSWPSPDMDTAAKHPAMTNDGWQGSLGVPTEIVSAVGYFDVFFTNTNNGYKSDFTGAEEFWMWVDCSDVQFKSCYTGFRVENAYGDDYYTTGWTNDPDMCYFTLADGATAWEKKSFTTSGTFDLSGFKGFVRFDADYFYKDYALYPDNLQAFVFGFTPKDEDQIGKSFIIDQIGFAGPEIAARDGLVQMLLDGQQFDKAQPLPGENSSQTSGSSSVVSQPTSTQTSTATSGTTSTNGGAGTESAGNVNTGSAATGTAAALALAALAGSAVLFLRKKEQ